MNLYAVVSEPDFYQFIPEDVPSRGDVQRIIEWSIQCNSKNTPTKIHKLNLTIVEKQSQEVPLKALRRNGNQPFVFEECSGWNHKENNGIYT